MTAGSPMNDRSPARARDGATVAGTPLPGNRGQLIGRYWQCMLSVARRYAGTATTAEDVAQEAAMQALATSVETFQRVVDVRSYLLGITRHVGISLTRKRLRRRDLLDRHSRLLDDSDGSTALRMRRFEIQEELNSVRTCARSLPKAQRAVIEAMCNGMSDREIADAYNIGVGSVRSNRSRALAKIRAMLQIVDSDAK